MLDYIALAIICITVILIVAMVTDAIKSREKGNEYLSAGIIRALNRNTKAVEALEKNLYLKMEYREENEDGKIDRED